VDVRHLVGAQRVGQELALVVVNDLLHRHPAETLHQAAFDLADVHRIVHALAEVVHQLHGIDLVGAAQCSRPVTITAAVP
jgi:hypothetical protein